MTTSYVFCSFLRMSMIMKANVSGLEAHTADFYELTADLDMPVSKRKRGGRHPPLSLPGRTWAQRGRFPF